jgi:hypothetical protein
VAAVTEGVFRDDEELYRLNGGPGGAYDQRGIVYGDVIDGFQQYTRVLQERLEGQAAEIKELMKKDYVKEINSLKAKALDGRTSSSGFQIAGSLNLRELNADNLPPSALDNPAKHYMPSDDEQM